MVYELLVFIIVVLILIALIRSRKNTGPLTFISVDKLSYNMTPGEIMRNEAPPYSEHMVPYAKMLENPDREKNPLKLFTETMASGPSYYYDKIRQSQQIDSFTNDSDVRLLAGKDFR